MYPLPFFCTRALYEPKNSHDCKAALSEYARLRCRTLTGLHSRKSVAAPETFLRSEDPTAWEAALVGGAPRERQASTVEPENGEESEEGIHINAGGGGETVGELLTTSALRLDSLGRIRSKLVSLRDAAWIGSKIVQMPSDGEGEVLGLEDLQRSDGHETKSQQQQWRRSFEEPKKTDTNTRHSWTIRSQDGCHIEEVTNGGTRGPQ